MNPAIILGLIQTGIYAYETIFSKEKKAGKKKKAAVKTIGKAAIKQAIATSTGGQKKSLQRMEKNLDAIIDNTVDLMNKEGKL